jgi:hypothetical protein
MIGLLCSFFNWYQVAEQEQLDEEAGTEAAAQPEAAAANGDTGNGENVLICFLWTPTRLIGYCLWFLIRSMMLL